LPLEPIASERFKSGFGALFVLGGRTPAATAPGGSPATAFGLQTFALAPGVSLGTTPAGPGDPGTKAPASDDDSSAIADVVRSAKTPLVWIQEAGDGFGIVLAVLVAAAVVLLALSALPPSVVRWTPIPVGKFVASRSYAAILALSLLLSALLVYTLGAIRF
jgi:hypothetical protein